MMVRNLPFFFLLRRHCRATASGMILHMLIVQGEIFYLQLALFENIYCGNPFNQWPLIYWLILSVDMCTKYIDMETSTTSWLLEMFPITCSCEVLIICESTPK